MWNIVVGFPGSFSAIQGRDSGRLCSSPGPDFFTLLNCDLLFRSKHEWKYSTGRQGEGTSLRVPRGEKISL